MAELLLELFSEEIPARMQTRAADDLKRIGDPFFQAGKTYQRRHEGTARGRHRLLHDSSNRRRWREPDADRRTAALVPALAPARGGAKALNRQGSRRGRAGADAAPSH